MEAAASSNITIIIYDNALYPQPPTKYTLKFQKSDLASKVKSRICEQTVYNIDKFDLVQSGKLFLPDDGMCSPF